MSTDNTVAPGPFINRKRYLREPGLMSGVYRVRFGPNGPSRMRGMPVARSLIIPAAYNDLVLYRDRRGDGSSQTLVRADDRSKFVTSASPVARSSRPVWSSGGSLGREWKVTSSERLHDQNA